MMMILADRLGDALCMPRVCREEVVDGYVGGMQLVSTPTYPSFSPCSWRGVGISRVPSREWWLPRHVVASMHVCYLPAFQMHPTINLESRHFLTSQHLSRPMLFRGA
jgi:hypothetical protein